MKAKLFRDPVHNIIRFDTGDPCEQMLIELACTPEFQRLRRIRQLGLANLVYPGAEHSRFTHSLGVTHLARRVLEQAAPKGTDPMVRFITLAAALLHDVGHGPFSHAIEKVTHIDHEAISTGLILDPDSHIHAILAKIDTTLPNKVAALIDGSAPRAFHTDIVSSQLDADRLDYILRDGLTTGVKIGVYDLERILSTLIPDPDHLLVSGRAKEAVEGYLMARFHMFKQVYLHKAVRSAEKMLEAALTRASERLRDAPFALPVPSPGLWSLLRGEPPTPRVFTQLDDTDIWVALKVWVDSDDKILGELADGLLRRKLYKTLVLPTDPKAAERVIETARKVIKSGGGDLRYHLMHDRASDTPYRPYAPGIKGQKPIMVSLDGGIQGRLEDHSDIIHLLGKETYEIERICFPERFRPALLRALDQSARAAS